MKNKYGFTACLLLLILAVSLGLMAISSRQEQRGGLQNEQDDFTVTASFYPMYVLTKNLTKGIDGVSLSCLSSPQTGCLHDYQPTAGDKKLLASTDLLVINGGGMESFLDTLDAEGNDLEILDASADLEESLLQSHQEDQDHEGHDHGEINPHFWMSLALYEQQIQTVSQGLAQADPAHESLYLENARAYTEEIEKRRSQLDALKESLQGRPVILFQESFAYLAKELGLTVLASYDLDGESSLSAKDIAQAMELSRENENTLLFCDSRYSRETGETVAEGTEASLLILDPMVTPLSGTDFTEVKEDDVLKAWDSNIRILQETAAVQPGQTGGEDDRE